MQDVQKYVLIIGHNKNDHLSFTCIFLDTPCHTLHHNIDHMYHQRNQLKEKYIILFLLLQVN